LTQDLFEVLREIPALAPPAVAVNQVLIDLLRVALRSRQRTKKSRGRSA